MKKVILIITAYIMMIISGTQALPEEAVSEIPTVVETPAIVVTEPEETAQPEPEPTVPFQPVIVEPQEETIPEEAPKEDTPVEEPSAEVVTQEIIPAEPEPQEEWTAPDPVEEEPKVEAEPEPVVPAFDVSQHVGFAQSYGTGIGLILDSTAVSCWDNPIAAHSGCVYIDRDLRDLLDWYRICGYTHFWVWSEDLGGGNYNIYLGYA